MTSAAYSAVDLAQAFISPRLRRRRFALLPLRGEGAPYTEAQGRAPGDSTAPAELVDLISSISEIGILQPVLAEELPNETGQAPSLRIVAGERRLRAARWGALHYPDNPHFAVLPAIVCPGPLGEEERRIWQLVENLAREPLQPGEQAAALLYQRCALLTVKLLHAGKPVPTEVATLADPVERFRSLERIRAGDAAVAAPWSEVLSRLGLQLSPRRARELVRAFAALPPEISEDMDAQRVALHTRTRFVALQKGRADAAGEIWAAVKGAGRTELLYAATGRALEDPQITPRQAVAAAVEEHNEAAAARATALRTDPAAPTRPATAQGEPAAGPDEPAAVNTPAPPQPREHARPAEAGQQATVLADTFTALRTLIRALHAGLEIGRYDRGSLTLLLTQANELISPPGNEKSPA